MSSLSRKQIEKLFELLNKKLRSLSTIGELYLVGGAVMCLAYQARESTKDIDAAFLPSQTIRKIAHEIAEEENLPNSWLNDGVKGFLSDAGSSVPYLESSHLKVFVATPEYLLALKCLAMRLGAEFHDESDIRFLLRYLNIESHEQALKIIMRYYPLERISKKTLYALEEILGSSRK